MTKRKKQTTELDTTSQTHQAIIDEYYANGMNGTLAVMTIKPEYNYNTAAVLFNSIKNNPNNTAYLDEKRARLKASADVQPEAVVKELMNIAFSDITQVIGLTVEELKQLPPDVRRCIDSVEYKDHYDKAGNYTGQTVKVKMKDSLKATEMINKYIGLYSEDNRQKGNNVNVLQVLQNTNPEALNSILLAMESVKK